MNYRAYGLSIDADFDLQLPRTSAPTDVTWRANQLALPRLFQTNIYRKGLRATIGGTLSESFLSWHEVGDFRATAGQKIDYQRFTADDGVFRLFALSEALGLLLLQRGLFLLHGSAVQIGQEATVFLGAPGAGKSSTAAAFAQQNHPVLSDDLTAIGFDHQQHPCVVPGFPGIKIWENTVAQLGFDRQHLQPAFEGHQKFLFQQKEIDFPTQPLPLRQIVVLQKPYSKQKEAVTAVNSPMLFSRHFPLPLRLLQDEALQRHFAQSMAIAKAVPLSNMPRPRSFEALQRWVIKFVRIQ